MGSASIYPTGTTIYEPEKCWGGYTVFHAKSAGATIIDMNGNVVRQLDRFFGEPHQMMPGGILLGTTGLRNSRYGYQDQKDLVQVDWEGNITWQFEQYEYIEDPGEEPRWMARLHHDFQREGNPVGYFVPGMEPKVNEGNTLILSHKNLYNPEITDKLLLDDTIIEVTWEGDIIWEWVCSDHFHEMGFSEDTKNTIYRNPNWLAKIGEGMGDWMHINAMAPLGPNRWYDDGDKRFHPDNIIWGARQTNIIAIIDKQTGKLVWQIGPDYSTSEALRKLGWIIGQHHAHMIPRGLPGEGNILVFDNGGWAGYGPSNPGSPNGFCNALRDFSRVLEIDPVTLKKVWQYTSAEAGFKTPIDNDKFYSALVSGAQRLPNGNTLITEGSDGRLFEVTPNHKLVWEYVSQFYNQTENSNMVYRSYRYPYEWIPQLNNPLETPVPRIDCSSFRVPGTSEEAPRNVSVFTPGDEFEENSQLCVVKDADLIKED